LGTLAFNGPSYSQNFDTLASSGTTATWANGTTLEGWYLFRQPAPGTAITAYAIGTGSGNGGSFYSFGATSAADRALGDVGSGGAYFGSLATTDVPVGWIAFAAVNKTGAALSSVTLDFDGEQWRNGGNTSAHAMALEYGLGGDDFAAITWTSAPASFTWTSPVVGSTAGAVDGNAAGLVDLVGGTLTGLTWNVDQTLWLRWVEVNNTGSDHGLAIDNFALSVPAATPGDMQITEYLYSGASGEYIEFTNVGGTAVDLTGWSFDDADRVPGAQSLSAFGIVQPGQSVILTEASADAFRTAWSLSGATPVIGGLTNNLGRGDEINLYDATSTLVDRLTYNDQNLVGTPRAQNASAWAPADQLANQTVDSDWRLSTLADAQNSRSSTGNDLGNPGHFNTGAAGVLVIEAGGATQLTEGGATDTYSLVLRSQPTANVTVTINGNSQVDPSAPSAVFTPANWNTPQTVTLTASDDALAEGTHTGTVSHTVTSADANYNARAVASVGATITDNDGAPLPAVNLSVSSTAGSEAAATRITITATASAAVAVNQTVSLGVTGTGITASDYYLTGTSITIPAGQSSGSVSFIVADDATSEAAETATLSLSNPSAGITLGATVSQNIAIANNDGSFLTKLGRATSTTASEIPAFDPGSDRVYVVAASTVNVYSMAANGTLSALPNLAPGFSAPAGTTVSPNSVAIHDGIVAVAYQVQGTATGAHLTGRVSFFTAATGAFLNSVAVGNLPDMLTFTPDGNKVLVANEGEPNSYGTGNSFDPEGSVSIIDVSGGVANATVTNASFTGFNSQIDALRASGVRITGPGATVAQDLEPEYITVLPGGTTALVSLQEANALARLDIATATFTQITPLGVTDRSLAGNGIDASDRDGGISIRNFSGTGTVQTNTVVGLYQPDAIASYSVDGQTYVITANEGDSRSYTGFNEEIRVNSAVYVLDPTIFPNAASLKLDANLGRLQLTNATGNTDTDGDIDRIEMFGARSFSIRDASGNLVYDSADLIEQLTATRTPTLFNSDGAAASFDTRSDNKGPEPEGVVIGTINTRIYAFIGLERVGDILVFDVSTPAAPQFIQYINTPEDVSVEGLAFVSAANSPTGKPLLITANEVSNTVGVFQINVPLHIRDIQGSSHVSPLNGQGVQNVGGIVTAIAANGFYLQDPSPDSNPATSEGIFVFTTNAAILGARTVGEAVQVSGTVSEFRPGGNADNLTITEIIHDAAVQTLTVTPWTQAPGTVISPTVIGNGGRAQPAAVINDDGNLNVETGGDFSPATEGIDFYESLEGMLVQINNPVATSPTAHFSTSEEIWVLPDDAANATSRTVRGASLITATDYNPERIQIDDLNNAISLPDVNVGARLGTITGVVSYDFNNFEVLVPNAPNVVQASGLSREVTALVATPDQLTVATFNVENLDPADGAPKFAALASAIVGNLRAPDILTLEEIQDNNGATNNGTVAADITLNTLIDAIIAAGGPAYQYRQIDPANNQDGGEPGGNIRVGFLFNPDRVGFVEPSLQRLTDSNLGDGDAFANSRKPLVGDFTFNGETVTVIANHFNSKGGDDPLFGPTQPPVLSSETQRAQQATIVADFVQARLALDANARIIVAGDLNDFEFSNPVSVLEGAGLSTLIEVLPAQERYTYNFQGNSQTLDHILTSASLRSALDGFDVVHMNSEFADQISDHDPSVARFNIERAGVVRTGDAGANTLVGTEFADTLIGGLGRDVLTGGLGRDRFVYTSLLDAGDRITDFVVGTDRLVVDQMLTRLGYAGSDPIGDGYLSVFDSGADILVTIDPDGSGGPAVARLLAELTGIPTSNAQELFF